MHAGPQGHTRDLCHVDVEGLAYRCGDCDFDLVLVWFHHGCESSEGSERGEAPKTATPTLRRRQHVRASICSTRGSCKQVGAGSCSRRGLDVRLRMDAYVVCCRLCRYRPAVAIGPRRPCVAGSDANARQGDIAQTRERSPRIS